jgi:hypothetical protein
MRPVKAGLLGVSTWDQWLARLAWSGHVNLENNERIYEVVSTPLHVKTLLSGSQDARDTGWR